MARIGKERKIEIRNKILEVSKDLFLSKGYEKTSTSQIAKNVGIAEGTIFNYFKTKADIFLGIMSVDFCNLTTEELENINFSNGVVDILMEFIDKSLRKILFLPKRILIELSIALFNAAKSNPYLVKKMAAIDFNFMNQVNEIIEKLQKQGLIKPCNPKVFSEAIYSVLMFEIMMYVYEKERSVETSKERMREKLEFICKGYV